MKRLMCTNALLMARVVAGPLPVNVKLELIGDIEIGRVWYGGTDKVLQELADRARALGADAGIGAKTWHQPTGHSWASWAAPLAHGQAVKNLNSDAARDLSATGKMPQVAVSSRRTANAELEARVGIEPAYTALQAAA